MTEHEGNPGEQATAIDAAFQELSVSFETQDRLSALKKFGPLIGGMNEAQKLRLREMLSNDAKTQMFNLDDPAFKELRELEFDICEELPQPPPKETPEYLAPARIIDVNKPYQPKDRRSANESASPTAIERSETEAQQITKAMAKLMTAKSLQELIAMLEENAAILNDRLTANEAKIILDKATELDPETFDVSKHVGFLPRKYMVFEKLHANLEHFGDVQLKTAPQPAPPETPPLSPTRPPSFIDNLKAIFKDKK